MTRVSTDDPKMAEVSPRPMGWRRIVALALIVASVFGAVGWFTVSTSRRMQDLETENAALRDRVSTLEGPRQEERVEAVGALVKEIGGRLGTVERKLSSVENDLSSLETSLYDFPGGLHFADPTIDDLDRRLQSVERRVESACLTLLTQFNAVPAC
jgi:chromosome segregation ATPase